jgi:hypothetical protein
VETEWAKGFIVPRIAEQVVEFEVSLLASTTTTPKSVSALVSQQIRKNKIDTDARLFLLRQNEPKP